MTTAAKLESMTDTGQFEHLATSVLRKADTKYAAIIHTGINAQGKTIVDPVDGLCLIPNSDPPHYIYVAHTTTNRSQLLSKWLTCRDADFTKASAKARAVRHGQPHAIFTVVLCTNQRVDSGLAEKVYAKANAEQLSVDIWEHTRLADFLDTTADGHWLRKHFLGIDAERLSEDHLNTLGHLSLQAYWKELLLPDSPPLVHRKEIETTLSEPQISSKELCLVVGRSGYGKSIVTAQALERWLSKGLLGIWLPARFLRDGVMLESALDAWLHELYPTLQPDAGREAINLAAKTGRLLVCVDDINRTSEATRLLRLVIGHISPPSETLAGSRSDIGNSRPASPLCLVVPLWPEQLTSLPAKLLENPRLHTVHVGKLHPDESLEMIRTRVPHLSVAEAQDYANRLSHDPFLVGLFAIMADQQMDAQQLRSVADNATNHFLREQLQELSSTQDSDLLEHELHDALKKFAHEMLIHRNLQPSWADLECWLGADSKSLQGLRALVKQSRICMLNPENRVDFRHDRLQQYFLIDAVLDLLRQPALPEEILIDPYYSSIVGVALAHAQLSPEKLDRLRKIGPWVLFETIREFGEPSNNHHNGLLEVARDWAANDSRTAPSSVVLSICWSLAETDCSKIIPIIDAMEPNHILMIAGLRNGSAQHGMRYLRSHAKINFEPGGGDVLRDRIVEHARYRHSNIISDNLRKQLARDDLTALDAKAYLALLGYFRFAGFGPLIQDIWKKHQDDVLYYAVWAAACCPIENVEKVLHPLVDRIAQLPVEEECANDMTDRRWMAVRLGWGFRRGITSEALACFLQASQQDEKLREDVLLLLKGVDHPDAIEFVIRNIAANEPRSCFLSELTGFGDGEPKTKPRSVSTSERLREIWESNTEPERVRHFAFSAWLQATDCKSIELLRSIGRQSPIFQYAVQHRVKLGDPLAASELLFLLKISDVNSFWWDMAHRVWCEELNSYAFKTLAKLRGTIPNDFTGGRTDILYHMYEVLVKIPVSDAETLLQNHWEHLKYSPRMIHAAFRIGTPACIAMAEESLRLCPHDTDIFRLAFSSLGNQHNPANPLSITHLQNLEPYLDRIGQGNLLSLVWEIETAVGPVQAVIQWINKHVVPRLPLEDQRRVRASDQMLVSHLDHSFRDTGREPYLGFLFEKKTSQMHLLPQQQIQVLDRWLASHSAIRGLMVIAECLKYIGTRDDLKLLDRHNIDGDATEIDRIKADAKFALQKRTLL